MGGSGINWKIICTSLQTDNHASIASLNFLQAGCSSWCHTNSVKALKASTECTQWMYTILLHRTAGEDANDTHQYKVSHAANNCTTCCRVVKLSTLCPINSKRVDESGTTVGNSFHATFGTFRCHTQMWNKLTCHVKYHRSNVLVSAMTLTHLTANNSADTQQENSSNSHLHLFAFQLISAKNWRY